MITARKPGEQVIEVDRARNKALYAEGLYRALKQASVLQKPLYITENGCANEDPYIKDEFLKKHLYAISRAIKEGIDVRGYFYWTLMDSFCWRRGYVPKYGIYKVNFETQERTLRPGFEHLFYVIQKFCHA
jgi:beta-glucosidase